MRSSGRWRALFRSDGRSPAFAALPAIVAVIGLLALAAPLRDAEEPLLRVGALLALAGILELLHAVRRADPARSPARTHRRRAHALDGVPRHQRSLPRRRRHPPAAGRIVRHRRGGIRRRGVAGNDNPCTRDVGTCRARQPRRGRAAHCHAARAGHLARGDRLGPPHPRRRLDDGRHPRQHGRRCERDGIR